MSLCCHEGKDSKESTANICSTPIFPPPPSLASHLAATATANAVLPTRLFHSKLSSNLASLKP